MSAESITNMAIHEQLLVLTPPAWWKVFNRPVAVPNGTGDNGSGISDTAAEDDSFIPSYSWNRLSDLRRLQERDLSLF